MSRCIHKLCVFNHVTTRMIRTLFCHRKLASLELHLNRLYEDKAYLTEKMAVRCRFGAAAEWLDSMVPRDSLQLVQSARRAGDPIFPRMPRREEPKATGAVVLLPEIGDAKALKKQARAGTRPLLFLRLPAPARPASRGESALPARDVVGSSLVAVLQPEGRSAGRLGIHSHAAKEIPR